MDQRGPHDPFDAGSARLSDLVDDLVVWCERRRQQMPSALAVVLVLAVVGAGGWWLLRPRPVVPIEDRIPMVAPPSTSATVSTLPDVGSSTTVEGQRLTVHVAGAVASPGVYRFDGDDRVIDAIEAAGGAEPGADLSIVNLAAPLVDGSQIRIPLVGEVLPVPLVPVGGAPASDPDATDAPVVLNQATASELERLPGVGPATAQAILDWRAENGPFVTIEQLLDVPGIGPAKFAAMADQVVLG